MVDLSTAAVADENVPMRLDDAISWFALSWPFEGPRLPSPDTVRTYRRHLNWLSAFAIGQDRLHVTDVDAELLRRAFQVLMAGGDNRQHNFKGGEAAANGLAAATHCLLGWLRAQGVPVADVSHVKPPRAPERVQTRLLPDEFRRLETAVLHQLVESDRRDAKVSVARGLALLYLLADTGLRAGEVCGMTTADVDLEIGRITVRRGKGNKPRALSIVDPFQPHRGETLRLLGEWLAIREQIRVPEEREHDFVWTSLQGRPLSPSELRRILGRLCADAGLPGNRPPHTFRRATFTETYRADPAAIDVLSARMGWSDRSHHMRQVYTRGAQLEFAAEVALPSMATLWHAGQTPTAPRFAYAPPERRQKPPARQPRRRTGSGPSRAELLARLNELAELLAASDA